MGNNWEGWPLPELPPVPPAAEDSSVATGLGGPNAPFGSVRGLTLVVCSDPYVCRAFVEALAVGAARHDPSLGIVHVCLSQRFKNPLAGLVAVAAGMSLRHACEAIRDFTCRPTAASAALRVGELMAHRWVACRPHYEVTRGGHAVDPAEMLWYYERLQKLDHERRLTIIDRLDRVAVRPEIRQYWYPFKQAIRPVERLHAINEIRRLPLRGAIVAGVGPEVEGHNLAELLGQADGVLTLTVAVRSWRVTLTTPTTSQPVEMLFDPNRHRFNLLSPQAGAPREYPWEGSPAS
jgi:hypothetical protein